MSGIQSKITRCAKKQENATHNEGKKSSSIKEVTLQKLFNDFLQAEGKMIPDGNRDLHKPTKSIRT
jgi:hypothetical protein